MSTAMRSRRIFGTVVAALAAVVSQVPLAVLAGATPPTPSITIATAPAHAYAGAAFGTQPVVTFVDPLFASLPAPAITVSLSMTAPSGASSAVLTCPSVTVSAPTTVGGTTGQANFVGCSIDTAATGFTVTASASIDGSAVTDTSGTFDVTALPALTLVFTQQPTATTGGVAISPSPAVSIEDSSSNVLNVTSLVSMSITSGTGASGAHLTCASVRAVAGVATFPNCAINKHGTGYKLTASSTNGGTATTVDSSAFDVTVGAASQLIFTQQPTAITAGSNFSSDVTLTIEDAGGNTVTTGTGATLSVFLQTYIGLATAPITCSDSSETLVTGSGSSYYYSVTAAAGVASFPKCTDNHSSPTGSSYSLIAEATDGHGVTLGAISTTFLVSPGVVSKLVFTTQPASSSTAGTLTTEPVVTLEDALGNVVNTVTTGDVHLAVTSGTGGSSASLTCSTMVTVGSDQVASATISHGVASYAGCSVTPSATAYTLTATYSTFSVVSSSFTTPVSGAASVSFTTQPGAGTGGSILTAQPVVSVFDNLSHLTSSSVTLSLSGSPSGVTLTCSQNPVSAPSGVASFAGCKVNKSGTYQLVATATGGATTTSNSFSVSVGPLAQLVMANAPTAAVGGDSFSSATTVTEEDLGGNVLTASSTAVTLALVAGTGAAGATLSCGGSSGLITAAPSSGVATFSSCSINRAGTGYELQATVPGALTMSAAFNVSAGTASALSFLAVPAGATQSNVFATAPRVAAVDDGGNVDTTFTGTVTLTSSSGDLVCDDTSVAAVAGVASFTNCEIPSTGSITLTASADSLSSATSGTIVVSHATPIGVVVTAQPDAQGWGAGSIGRSDQHVVNDVNTATGELDYATTDLRVQGLGVPLVLTRTYNSSDTAGGLFGPGWSSILDSAVSISGTSAIVRGPDGQRLIFTSAGPGLWSAPPGSRSTLTCSGISCTLVTVGGPTLLFSGGRLVAVRSAAGIGLALVYSGAHLVTINVARNGSVLAVTVAEDSGGQITALSTPTRTVHYSYPAVTAGSLLTAFTDANGHIWTYGYGSRLTTIVAPSHHTWLHVTYSGARVLTAQCYGQGALFYDSYGWNAATHTATRFAHIQSAGGPTTASFSDSYLNGAIISETLPSGSTTGFSYDGQMRLIEAQHGDGSVWSYQYDAAGNLLALSAPDSLGQLVTTTYTYNGAHQLTSVTDPDGAVTRYSYAGANLASATLPGETATTYTYDAFGERLSATTVLGTTHYSYDTAGNLVGETISSPSNVALNGLGPVNSFNEAGQIVSATTARGHLLSSLNPLFTTHYVYDPTGQLVTLSRGNGSVTTSGYDVDGNLISTATTFDPFEDKASTTTTAVSGLTTTSTTQHNTTTTGYAWSYAAAILTTSHSTSVTVDTSAVTSPSTTPVTTHTVTTSTPLTGVTTYDPSGNVLSTQDATGHVTVNTYSSADQLASSTSSDGVTTSYSYDALGRLASTSDGTGRTTSSTYDAAGDTMRHSVDGAQTTYTYDRAGHRLSATSPTGAVTHWLYNAAGQVAAIATPAGTTNFSYNSLGQLSRKVEPSGRAFLFIWNGANELIDTVNASAVTAATYDADGNLATLSQPSGRLFTVTTSPEGQRTKVIAALASASPTTTTYSESFNAAGQLVGATGPAGAQSYSYDAAGNLITATVAAGQTFTYAYPSAGTTVETYPDGTKVTTSDDDAGNVMSVTSASIGAAYLRDAQRREIGVALSNGQIEMATSNAHGLPATAALTCAGTTESTAASTYSTLGEPVSFTAVSGSTTTAQQLSYTTLGWVSGASTATSPPSATTTPATPCTSGAFSAPASPGANFDFVPLQNDGSGTLGTLPGAPSTAPTLNGPSVVSTASAPTGSATTYDGNGNVTSLFGVSATTNAIDELSSLATPTATTYNYDADGHLTSATSGANVTSDTYNAAGQLASVTTPSATISYTYDARGFVASRTVTASSTTTTTTYLWDPLSATAQLDLVRQSGSVLRRYFYGAGPLAMQTVAAGVTQTYFLTTDSEGNVTGAASATGQQILLTTYSPFGAPSTVSAPGAPSTVSETITTEVGGLRDAAVSWTAPSSSGGSAVTGYIASATLEGRTCTAAHAASCGGACQVTAASTGCSITGLNATGTYDYVVQAINGDGFSSAYPAPVIDLGLHGQFYDATASLLDTGQGFVDVGTGRLLSPTAVTASVSPALSPYVAANNASSALLATPFGLVAAFAASTAPSSESSFARSAAIGLGTPLSANPATSSNGVSDLESTLTTVAAPSATVAMPVVPSSAAGAVPTPDESGPIAPGVVSASSPTSSGFNNFVEELVRAGYSSNQMATVLVNVFGMSQVDAINELIHLRYDADGIAVALAVTFSQSQLQVASAMSTLGYTVTQIAAGLQAAF